MLPLIPLIAGGVALFGAGIFARKYYKENELEIDGKIFDTCQKADEWLSKKLDELGEKTENEDGSVTYSTNFDEDWRK